MFILIIMSCIFVCVNYTPHIYQLGNTFELSECTITNQCLSARLWHLYIANALNIPVLHQTIDTVFPKQESVDYPIHHG